jgi:hypothetical protein
MRTLMLYRLGIMAAAALAILLLSAFRGAEGEIVMPVAFMISVALFGMGLGVTKNKADAAHARLDRHEKTVADVFAKQDHKLDEMHETLTEIRVMIAEQQGRKPGSAR